jgi:acetyltransferase-like isoleucine patch superfamily enzyme
VIRRANYVWGPRIASAIRRRWVIVKNPHVEIRFGKDCYLGPGFDLKMPHRGRFIAGDSVEFRRGFRCEIWEDGSVTIGNACAFGDYSLIQCSTSIEIGSRSGFGQACLIVDGNHRYEIAEPHFVSGFEMRPIRIADDVAAHTKSTILNDIGAKAIVGANAVVNRPVPPYSMVAGVPARLIDYFGPPELEPSEWAERRRTRGEAEQRPRPGRLEVSGDSVAFGGGVSAFKDRFTTRLAELLDAEEMNRAVPDAIVCSHETGASYGDGGYARVLQSFTRPPDPAGVHSEGLVCLTYYGMSELALLGDHDLLPFEHALRTVISRHRASAVFEESHDSVSPRGWRPRGPEGPDCSGSGVMETSAEGATLTISVPPGFPGGTVAMGFVAAAGGGAEHVFEVDGVAGGTLDTRGITEPRGNRNGAVMRLTGLSPGVHVIVCRVVNPTGVTAFDYWQIEPEPGPPVLVPLGYTMPDPIPRRDWSFYAGWADRPTPAMVGALNEGIRRVTAEFGAGVDVVEVEPVLASDPELFAWGGAHPNDEGHARLARACHQTLARRPTLVAQR